MPFGSLNNDKKENTQEIETHPLDSVTNPRWFENDQDF